LEQLILQSGCLSCRPNHSIRALMGPENTDTSQRKSRAGLPFAEGRYLHPLYQPFSATTDKQYDVC